jgi:hypothetical protein
MYYNDIVVRVILFFTFIFKPSSRSEQSIMDTSVATFSEGDNVANYYRDLVALDIH